MSKVLVISPDEIKKEMAGPAIRAFEIARHLERNHKVTLVYEPQNLAKLMSEHDVIICQHLALNKYPILRKTDKSLVFDLYNLSMFECLEIAIEESPKYQALLGEYHPLLKIYLDILKVGDFFICANEHQRDFWLGMLAALGRIDVKQYKDDDNLKNLIDIVPFGISDEPPAHTRTVLKGVYPEIKPQDKVVIWAGGVYDWLDPLISIRAMHKIAVKRPEVKLFFMGIENPIHPLLKTRLCHEAIKLSKDLELYNKCVFFNSWVDYHQRQNYLLEADIGITTQHKNMESYYSCRPRVLDYIWVNLPIIISEGDGFSEMVKHYNLGLVVKDNDAQGLAEAILRLVDDTNFYNQCKQNLKNITPDFYWDRLIVPLNRFCQSPRLTQDRPVTGTPYNRLLYRRFQVSYYISHYGYKGLMIRIFKQISEQLRRIFNRCVHLLRQVLAWVFICIENTLVLIFSICLLCITFVAILLNDIIVMPLYQREKT